MLDVLIGVLAFVVAPVAFGLAVIVVAVLPRVKCRETCAQCGYSREGLAAAPSCPECGHQHGVVVDPAFRRVARSGRFYWWYMAVPPALGMIAGLVLFPQAASTANWMVAIAAPVLGLATIAPAPILCAIAAWRVSTTACWCICMSASLPGALFFSAVIWGEGSALSISPWDVLGLASVAFVGAGISGAVGGIVAGTLGMLQHRRIPALRESMKRQLASVANTEVAANAATPSSPTTT